MCIYIEITNNVADKYFRLECHCETRSLFSLLCSICNNNKTTKMKDDKNDDDKLEGKIITWM